MLGQDRPEKTQPNVNSKRRDSESSADIDLQNQLHLTWFTYNCTESYTPQPVDLTPIPQLLPYMQSFFSFGQHVIYQILQRRYKITGSST